jgi:hypothetical protein
LPWAFTSKLSGSLLRISKRLPYSSLMKSH